MKLPGFLFKPFLNFSLIGKYIQLNVKITTIKRNIKEELQNLIIKVDDLLIFDIPQTPTRFFIKIGQVLYDSAYHMKELEYIDNLNKQFELYIPNTYNINPGKHKINFINRLVGSEVSTKMVIELSESSFNPPTIISKIKNSDENPKFCKYCGYKIRDRNQRICEVCGGELY